VPTGRGISFGAQAAEKIGAKEKPLSRVYAERNETGGKDQKSKEEKAGRRFGGRVKNPTTKREKEVKKPFDRSLN